MHFYCTFQTQYLNNNLLDSVLVDCCTKTWQFFNNPVPSLIDSIDSFISAT